MKYSTSCINPKHPDIPLAHGLQKYFIKSYNCDLWIKVTILYKHTMGLTHFHSDQVFLIQLLYFLEEENISPPFPIE